MSIFLSRERLLFSHFGLGLVNSQCLPVILFEFNGFYLIYSFLYDGFIFYKQVAKYNFDGGVGRSH